MCSRPSSPLPVFVVHPGNELVPRNHLFCGLGLRNSLSLLFARVPAHLSTDGAGRAFGQRLPLQQRAPRFRLRSTGRHSTKGEGHLKSNNLHRVVKSEIVQKVCSRWENYRLIWFVPAGHGHSFLQTLDPLKYFPQCPLLGGCKRVRGGVPQYNSWLRS